LHACVEVELDDRRLHLVALRRRRNSRDLRQPRDVEIRYRAEAAVIDLGGLHRRAARLRIADEARDDAIEVRLAGAPVFGVAVEAHVLAALPFDELERSGADRIVRVLAVLDIGPGEEVLGHDRRFVARQRHHHVRRRRIELEYDGVRIRRVDRYQRAERVDAARMEFLSTSMIENWTSALVNGVPSWNLTPSRSLNVIVLPSALSVHDVARLEIGLRLKSYSKSPS